MSHERSATAVLHAHSVPVVVGRAYLLGSIPFSGVLARVLKGVDLRKIDTGTVSGTGLFRVAGWKPLFAAGSLDVAKGIVAVAAVPRERPALRNAAAVAAVAGHNWSPWLRGSGGRGLSVALGATTAHAPEATVTLGLGLAIGKLSGQTGLGAFLAQAALPVVLARRGHTGVALGVGLTGVMWAKRLAGNRPAPAGDRRVYLRRLLFDHD